MDVSLSWRRASALGSACFFMWCGLDSPLFTVPAWTAAQPGVTHVLADGRNLAQVTENAKAVKLEVADPARNPNDVIVLGEPVKV